MQLTDRDMERLDGVHPDLVQLVRCVAVNPPIKFMVDQGLRTPEKQAEYVAAGTSWTMNSRHLTGHAVDLIPLHPDTGDPTWDWQYYHPWAEYVKEMAYALGTMVTWGGDWETKQDGPHWELDWDWYPLTPSYPPPEEPETVEA